MKYMRMLLSVTAALLLTTSCYFKINRDLKHELPEDSDSTAYTQTSMEYDEPVRQIINSGYADIEIYQSDSLNRYELEIDPELSGKVSMDFVRGTLTFNCEDDLISKSKYHAKVKVWSTGFNSVVLAGVGNITFPGRFNCEDLSISIAGSGAVEAEDVNASGRISIVIAGAGQAEFAGAASSFRYNIAGVGKVDVRKLRCDDISGDNLGMGKIYR